MAHCRKERGVSAPSGVGFGSKKTRPLPLRKWQQEALAEITEGFVNGKKLKVVQACTASGKTRLGTECVFYSISGGSCDLTVVLAPSTAVAEGWVRTFNTFPGIRAVSNASSGSKNTGGSRSIEAPDTNVWVLTYPGYRSAIELLRTKREVHKGIVLVVDEYHHAECNYSPKSEDTEAPTRLWGQAVEEFYALSKHCIMLSGTPWREEGYIALLLKEGRYEKLPDGSEVVRPDICYEYRDDLRAIGNDRGTVTVECTFVDSALVDETSGKEVVVLSPESRKDKEKDSMEEYEMWARSARNCNLPVGPHVNAARLGGLAGSAALPKMLRIGASKLKKSRNDLRRATDGEIIDGTVMLVVASSQKSAENIKLWIEQNLYLKTVQITSDDKKAAKQLSDVVAHCAAYDADKPDVIVSVGMISEGVDIPQIKVVVYASAILTRLYIEQVIGRLLRRMPVEKKGLGRYYADKWLEETPGYFISVAHDKIMYIAGELESVSKQAVKERRIPEEPVEPGSDGESKPKSSYKAYSRGEVSSFYRGKFFSFEIREITQMLLSHPKASECMVCMPWVEYIMYVVENSKEGSAERQEAVDQIRQKCECLGVDYDATLYEFRKAQEDPEFVEEDPRPYDEQMYSTKKELSDLVKTIAGRCRPYYNPVKEEMDFQSNIPLVWGAIKVMAGLRRSHDYHASTIAELKAMLRVARQYLQDNLVEDNGVE